MKTKRSFKISKTLLWAAASVVLMGSCVDVDDGSYVDPIRLTEKIGGSWILNSITQTDETTGNEMTLTNLLDFDTFSLDLSEGGQFSVVGNAPKLLPVSGTWELDNDFVKSTGEATQLVLKGDKGTARLTVTATPGASPELGFQLTRKQNGAAFVSYKYQLTAIE